MFFDFAIEIRDFCSVKWKICRIKRRIEVFRVCLKLVFSDFFAVFTLVFFAVFSPRKIDFLICSKKSAFCSDKTAFYFTKRAFHKNNTAFRRE